MVDQGSEVNLFQGINVRNNTRIDIYISIRPMTIKFGKQIHLQELIHHIVYLPHQSTYGHQIW